MVQIRRFVFALALALVATGCGSAVAPSQPAGASTGTVPSANPGATAGTQATSGSGSGGQQPAQTIRFALNPTDLTGLPIMVGVDRGLFRQAGVDVVVTKIFTSTTTLVQPLNAGQLDMAALANSLPLYRIFANGARIRLLVPNSQDHAGSFDPTHLVVRRALWDSGTIHSVADLRGKRIDVAAFGTPFDYMMRTALAQAGVPISAVHYTATLRGAAAWLAALKGDQRDAVTMTEPTAEEALQQSIGVPWLGGNDVLPGWQTSMVAVNTSFLAQHPRAVRAFLVGYLRAVRFMLQTDNRWTPALLQTAHRWTKLPDSVIQAIGGVPYADPNGRIDTQGILTQEHFWHGRGLLPTVVPPSQMIDTKPLEQALQVVGRR